MIIEFEYDIITRLVDLSEYKIIENSLYSKSESILNNGYVLIMGYHNRILINTDIFTGIGKIEYIAQIDNKNELISTVISMKREMVIENLESIE